MPQAEIVFIENTTHMLPLENPSTVSKEIINFL
jgi:pimeloyl-ACP methyl ester carboxylesterase